MACEQKRLGGQTKNYLQADTKCTERIQKGLVDCTQYFCVVDIIGSSDGHNCYSPDRIVMPQDIYSTRFSLML
jgi:hypothetical protein